MDTGIINAIILINNSFSWLTPWFISNNAEYVLKKRPAVRYTLIGLFRSPLQNVCKETVNFFQDGFKLFLMTWK